MYSTEKQAQLIEQQRIQNEQLRREASVQRIEVSKALDDIKKYVLENQDSDILLMGFSADKHNPYHDKSSCLLL